MNTEQVTTSTAEQALEKMKTIAEQQFLATVNQVNELVSQCKAIKITDATTLSMAEQKLSLANRALKEADEKRKAFNRPADDRIKFVNSFVKTKITTPLEEAVNFGKEQMRKWNEEEKIRAKQQEESNNKNYEYLKALEVQLNQKINLCNTPENCDSLIGQINEKWPVDSKFGSYLQEANQTKNNFITTLQYRKKALIGAASGIVSEVVESVKEQEITSGQQAEVSAAIDERKEAVSSSIVASKSNTRKTYKYEIADELKMPRAFLSPDAGKIREYLSTIKDKVTEEGVIIGGVRFYIDNTPVIK